MSSRVTIQTDDQEYTDAEIIALTYDDVQPNKVVMLVEHSAFTKTLKFDAVPLDGKHYSIENPSMWFERIVEGE